MALDRAINDKERGLSTYHPIVDEDAIEYFSTQSQGDVSALNALELAVLSAHIGEENEKTYYIR